MKKYLSIIIIFSISILKGQTLTFGEDISKYQIDEKIKVQELFDSKSKFNTKFKAEVTDVCQVKGCWMRLNIGNDIEVMVNFKDYGFFVPRDIIGKNVFRFSGLLQVLTKKPSGSPSTDGERQNSQHPV